MSDAKQEPRCPCCGRQLHSGRYSEAAIEAIIKGMQTPPPQVVDHYTGIRTPVANGPSGDAS